MRSWFFRQLRIFFLQLLYIVLAGIQPSTPIEAYGYSQPTPQELEKHGVKNPTQACAGGVCVGDFGEHRSGRITRAAGLRWWSSWEALWANVTVFDRAAAALRAIEVTELTLDHPQLLEAADLFGLRVV